MYACHKMIIRSEIKTKNKKQKQQQKNKTTKTKQKLYYNYFINFFISINCNLHYFVFWRVTVVGDGITQNDCTEI